MHLMLDPEFTPEWFDELLTLPTLEEQSAFLRAADLLNEVGIAHLLNEVDVLVRRNPAHARQLAELCQRVAKPANAPIAAPRAAYLQAQSHAIHGDFDTALALIETAQTGYAALGMELEALRTNVGKMSVLLELGQHQALLAVGQAALSQTAQITAVSTLSEDGGVPSAEVLMLTASVHVNSGIAYGKMGRYHESIQTFVCAEEIYGTLGELSNSTHDIDSDNITARLANVISNQGVALVYLGQARAALEAFARASTLRTNAAPALPHAQTLINIGQAHLLLGNYMQSLQTFEEAQTLLETLNARVDVQINLIHMADAYRVLNLYPEALAMYRTAGQIMDDAEMAYEHAVASWGMGSTLLAQSRYAPAHAALTEAAARFAQVDNQPLRAGVLLELAALQAKQGEDAAALTTAYAALDAVGGSAFTASAKQNADSSPMVDAYTMAESGDWPVQQIYAHMRVSDLLLPDMVTAERHLEAAEQLLAKVTLPHLRYRLQQRLGHLRLLQGRDQDAEQLLRTAIGDVERLRNTLTHEALRTSFLRDKMAAYEDLLQLYLKRLGENAGGDENEEAIQQAFGLAERAKSRALVDRLIGAVGVQINAADGAAVAHLRALQADLNAVYNKLLTTQVGADAAALGAEPEGQARTLWMSDLQTHATKIEQEISRTLLRLQSTGAIAPAESFRVPFGEPFGAFLPLAEIHNHLPAAQIVVAYHTIGHEVMAFVAVGQQVQVVRHLSTVAVIQQLIQKLQQQWARLRAMQVLADRHMAMLEESTRRVLAQLYVALFAPVEALLTHMTGADAPVQKSGQPRALAIVPHGVIHQIPFQALYDGQGYLLERFELAYAPSATVLALQHRRAAVQTSAARSALIMGVAGPDIPAVEAEVNAVARQLPQAVAYLNEAATIETLMSQAATASVLHLACHGLFRADNPMFSALKLHDGWLTATDLAQLDLAGALVVLSACESGRGDVLAGDEIIGLARACLGAGAATLIVSHWLVQDDTGAIVMAELYARLAQGQTPAAALRAAQLVLKSSHPHPYHWAPFVLMGSR